MFNNVELETHFQVGFLGFYALIDLILLGDDVVIELRVVLNGLLMLAALLQRLVQLCLDLVDGFLQILLVVLVLVDLVLGALEILPQVVRVCLDVCYLLLAVFDLVLEAVYFVFEHRYV